ncbi:MAG: aminopeptidase [Lachnospiraceae bacterium]|nr:aminopeptidase [Lachnospiraceae bacterium]
MNQENAWKLYTDEQCRELETLSDNYKDFLNKGKTERECVKETVKQAEAAGYRSLETICAEGKQLQPGDKVYAVCMNKAIALFLMGKNPMKQGMKILGAHIDSPRLDLKQNPLYEDTEMAFLDTHYYGGVKKYQWVTIPLAMHGVVAKKDGTMTEICIGEDEMDPIFCVTDLLIHLSGEQLEKKARVVIEGENLDVLVGSRPLTMEKNSADAGTDAAQEDAEKKEKDAVKAGILKILKDKYDMEEEDFLSAEIEIVPAGNARDCGLDRSMIAAYGQDDRVCAYTSLAAMLKAEVQDMTCCCLLVDKEEIGSVGATGMQSRFFENTVAEVMNCAGQYSELDLRRCLSNCKMLSSDVSAAYDPLYAAAYEKRNAAYFGKGMVFNKYTGARGKSGSNDANAEYLGWLRGVMDKYKVTFQTAELGKVDIGGGGTIAFITALYGMDVVDSGVAVLNMHAPMEITSKSDVYETMKGYCAFFQG